MTKARARLPINSPMSYPEYIWYNGGYLSLFALEQYADLKLEVMTYERISFNVPGGKYTPDFNVILSNGIFIFVEVKEGLIGKSDRLVKAVRLGSYRDSRSKLRAAAATNPWFDFIMAVLDRSTGSWQLETISNDTSDWGGKIDWHGDLTTLKGD